MILFDGVEVIFTVKIMLNMLIEPVVTNISEVTVEILKIYILKSIFKNVYVHCFFFNYFMLHVPQVTESTIVKDLLK